jgi:hypothetical protein
MDWGLIFKPYFWLFMIAPPAYAYSFFFAFQMFSFLYGYRQLFRLIGISDELAAGGALLLFFCGYTQYWWTTVGPSLSFFPWVVLAAMLRHTWWKYVLFGYVVVAWIFGIAYPPLIIALCFVAILLCCAFRGEATWGMKEISLMVGAAACALALVGVYYRDLLAATMHTVYPGHRRSSSGSVSLRLLIGMFAPAFNQVGYQALGPINICESGVVGSFLPVSVIAFIDYHGFKKLILAQTRLFPRRQAVIVGAGTLLMLAWIFVPVPVPFGKVFLWQFVPGSRMLFPLGVLVTLLCLWLLNACGVVLTVPRISVFFSIVLVSVLSSKYVWSLEWKNTPIQEFLILPTVVAGAILAWRRQLTARQVVIYACVLANIALFGFFNPILSAKEIFVSRDTPIIRSLEKKQRENAHGWLVTLGFPGAVLNGQGFRSIQHVLLSPHLQFFREYFPEIPEAEFNNTFNRYAHINLVTADKPYSPQPDVVAVPIARFGYTEDPASRVVATIPTAGDFDGDGKTDYGVWRPTDGTWQVSGTWFIEPSSRPDSRIVKQWGLPDDIPVFADFDGDGKADYAVWRRGSAVWYITLSSTGAIVAKQWGMPGDLPVAGDFDGDGKADYAVWRPANAKWHIVPSSHPDKQIVKQWGLPGDIPVVADFDGDKKADFAVWRPSNNSWYILPSVDRVPIHRHLGF